MIQVSEPLNGYVAIARACRGAAPRPYVPETASCWPSLSSPLNVVGDEVELSKVGKITHASNPCAAPPAVTALGDVDTIEHRLGADAQLVGQAQAEPGFP